MKIIGRFYFKRTSNGNLIGEWSNNDKNEIRTFTESSDLITPNDDSYAGEYNSTWQEKQKPFFAKLKISQGNLLFSLEWFDLNGKPIFKGTGMLCDDILIGDYHNVP